MAPAWGPDSLEAEIERAVNGYVASLADEEVSGSVQGVTARVRLDGTLTRVVFDRDVPRRYGPTALGELVVHAVQAAMRSAEQRRVELAGSVTFLDRPVLELVQDMIDDPAGTTRRLAAGR
jgi:DNA-binding protein YbaB